MHYSTINSGYVWGFHFAEVCTFEMLHLKLENCFNKTRLFGSLNIKRCYLKSKKVCGLEPAVIREL